MVGQALSFDGIDDSVEVPYNTNLNLQQALTIEAWIMKQGDCTNNCFIVMKQNDTTTPCCESFRYGLLAFQGGGQAALSFNTGVWEDVVVSQTVLQDHVWYHVAGTYDGSTANIYVNGVLDNSVPKTGTILASTAGPLFIGQNVGGAGSGEFFNGLIDEVAIYNRALSAEEVAAIFNARSAGKCKAPSLCTLDLTPSLTEGMLTLDVQLGTQEPATWNIWLTAQNEITRLLSLPLGVLDPPVSVPFTIPFVPSLGTVGVLTTLTTPDQGIICSDFATVDTGPVSEDAAVSVHELQDVLQPLVQ
jgi:hypothetical protein